MTTSLRDDIAPIGNKLPIIYANAEAIDGTYHRTQSGSVRSAALFPTAQYRHGLDTDAGMEQQPAPICSRRRAGGRKVHERLTPTRTPLISSTFRAAIRARRSFGRGRRIKPTISPRDAHEYYCRKRLVWWSIPHSPAMRTRRSVGTGFARTTSAGSSAFAHRRHRPSHARLCRRSAARHVVDYQPEPLRR